MKKWNAVFILLAGVFLIVGNAAAIPVDIAVDFRDAPWNGGNNLTNIAVGNITVTAGPTGALLYQDNVDGFGIRGGEIDEIDGGESLNINISGGGMYLTGAWITDLFAYPDGSGDLLGERGRVTINDSFSLDFYGNFADQVNGELFVDFGGNTLVTKLQFLPIGSVNNEFSVAGLTAVPEPATLFLLGLGLIGIAGYGGRKFK